MSNADATWLYWLTWIGAGVLILIGYGIGFYQGWSLGKKAGEAIGIAWATERIRSL